MGSGGNIFRILASQRLCAKSANPFTFDPTERQNFEPFASSRQDLRKKCEPFAVSIRDTRKSANPSQVATTMYAKSVNPFEALRKTVTSLRRSLQMPLFPHNPKQG